MAAPVGQHAWRQGVGQFPQRMGVLSPEERQLFFPYICKDCNGSTSLKSFEIIEIMEI